jgi:hypothetical protein
MGEVTGTPQRRRGQRPTSASKAGGELSVSSGLLLSWSMVWVFLLGWTLYQYFANVGEEPPAAYKTEGILLGQLWMLALSFPCGFLWGLVNVGLVSVLPSHIAAILDRSVFWIVLNWLGLFACGYVQWWRIVPWIVRRLRQFGRRDDNTNSL